MSDFRFACPHCGQRISCDSQYRGTEIPCPSCQQTLTVPAPVAKAPIAAHAESPTTPAVASGTGKMSPLALVSLVCSLGLGAGSIPGIVCGHLARARIRRDPSLRGKGMATAGLIISYSCLLGAIAFLFAGFFLLGPKEGHQLTTKEQAANTAAVLTSRRVDEVKINDPVSESAHEMKVRFSRSGDYSGRMVRDALNGGFVSYTMKVDATQPVSLYCTYWGNDGDGRRFDILVNDEVIATQTLNFNDPGHFFDVEYHIPQRLTRGHSNVTVVFQGYPRKTVGGLFGCQMLKR
jgi:Domain of unknown function (DUF4190)